MSRALKPSQWIWSLCFAGILGAACSESVHGTGGGDGDGDGDGDGLGGDSSGDGDQESGGSGTQTGGNGTGGQSGTGGAVTSCIDQAIGDDVVSANTALADNVIDLSCASGNSPDLIYAWTAPISGYFSFDTAGSSYDTAVAVLAGCEGEEIACSSGVGDSPHGRAVAQVQRDETYVVVLSGNSGASGDAQLSVSEVTCPETDLSGQPLPAQFTTVGSPDNHTPPCDRQGITPQPEKTFRFTAEEAGLYRFSATSTAFRPVITVYRGVICGGDYLACNAAQVGATAHPAQVGRYLEAGESVTVIVEGEDGSGQFNFNIEKLPEAPSGGCYDVPSLGTGVSGTISPSMEPNEVSASCAWAGNSTTHYSEAMYKFTVDIPDSFNFCAVEVELTGVGGVYLLEGGDCSGPELECHDDGYNFIFSRSNNGEYLVVVEDRDPFGSSISYSIISNCD